ncbi:MAG TPA: hypothetical protein VFI47_05380 [Acidimicrobiales bacterium]|nr:hypothetical protein [Acidimicrobiales bacterium]
MADVKDEISVTLAGHLARELTTAWPEFPRRRFTRGLGDALAPLAGGHPAGRRPVLHGLMSR